MLPHNGAETVAWISADSVAGTGTRMVRKLVLSVDYCVPPDSRQVADACARGLLLDLADHAAQIGALSGDTALTVASWTASFEA